MSVAGAEAPTAIDLYSGVGGLSLGLNEAGFEVVAGIEADRRAARYYSFNHPATRVFCERVSREGVARAARSALDGRELCIVAGGPPCQGFSWAGRRTAKDLRNLEIDRFVDAVILLKPLAFILENVRGILSHGREVLKRAEARLERCYSTSTPQLLRASAFGVPQARERMFLFGLRRDLGIVPDPIVPLSIASPTVWDALEDVPVAEPGDEDAAKGIPYECAPRSDFAKAMRGELDEVGWRGAGIPEWSHLFCTNSVPTRHGDAVRRRFGRVAHGGEEPISRLRRLDPNDVAVTIRAGTTSEYGSRSAPRPIHPFEDRVLTTRECARLQSFPDWYLFHPTKWHGNRQVGNAVPPRLARSVALHIRGLLGFAQPALGEGASRREYDLIADDYEGAPWLERAMRGDGDPLD